MYDTAIIAGLVFGDGVLGFQYHHTLAAALHQRQGRSQANDTPPHNRHFRQFYHQFALAMQDRWCGSG